MKSSSLSSHDSTLLGVNDTHPSHTCQLDLSPCDSSLVDRVEPEPKAGSPGASPEAVPQAPSAARTAASLPATSRRAPPRRNHRPPARGRGGGGTRDRGSITHHNLLYVKAAKREATCRDGVCERGLAAALALPKGLRPPRIGTAHDPGGVGGWECAKNERTYPLLEGAVVPERSHAQAGLRALGWLDSPAHFPWLEADVVRGAGWVIGRVWSAGATVKGNARLPGTLHVIIGAKGRGSVVVDGVETTLQDREVGIFEPRTQMQLSSPTPWARFEWVFAAPALSLSRVLRPRAPLTIPTTYWEIISATTSIVVAGSEPPEAAFPPLDVLGPVLEHLLSAAIADADAVYGRENAGDTKPLMRRARELISANSTNPGYGVSDLQRDLALSKTHMHRLFAERGTTPRRELEAQRVDAALTLMASPQGASLAPKEVAEATGFRSVERMMSALARRRESLQPAPADNRER